MDWKAFWRKDFKLIWVPAGPVRRQVPSQSCSSRSAAALCSASGLSATIPREHDAPESLGLGVPAGSSLKLEARAVSARQRGETHPPLNRESHMMERFFLKLLLDMALILPRLSLSAAPRADDALGALYCISAC